MGPANRPAHTGSPPLQSFTPESPIETANRELKMSIKAAARTVDGVKKHLLEVLADGTIIADNDVNIALFERVREDIMAGKVTNLGVLGRRIPGLKHVNERVNHAVSALDTEEEQSRAASLAPAKNNGRLLGRTSTAAMS